MTDHRALIIDELEEAGATQAISKFCGVCRACEGSAYQTPPAYAAGNTNAPILILGQAPSEIAKLDHETNFWVDYIFGQPNFSKIAASGLDLWHLWHFITSGEYEVLAEVFGPSWLDSGQNVWSTAVRCRIPDDADPSEEMRMSCSVWTDQLATGKKAIVMVGEAAREQILKEKAPRLEWGKAIKDNTLGIYLLAMKHHKNWLPGEAENYKKAFNQIEKAIL